MTLTRRGRLVAVLTTLTLVGLAVSGGAYLYLASIGVTGSSDPGERVTVVIHEGTSAVEVGEVLAEAGVIRSAFGWRVALFFEDGEDDIQAGNYELPRGLTARDALSAMLDDGPSVEFVMVTFPEGSWLTDFARILERDTHLSGERFLEVVTTGRVRSKLLPDGIETLEGLLFPSTYQVVETDTERSVAQRLVDELEDRVAQIDFSRVQEMGHSTYDAVIVASMVEAEAKVDEERPKIASVIYNRLEVEERLGIDATVLYALGEHKQSLTLSDLAVDSPYNTRLYAGLPPTPIGAPGQASLEAAADPAEGDLFFFVVSDCEGHHAFSSSAEQFARDKAAYQALDC